jgi:hypothetical protein
VEDDSCMLEDRTRPGDTRGSRMGSGGGIYVKTKVVHRKGQFVAGHKLEINKWRRDK